MVVSFVIAVPAAWLIARKQGRLQWLLLLVIGTYMLPPLLFVVPLYHIFSSANLLNSPWALMIADSTIVLPFTAWLLKGGIESIPHELEQAAQMDGAPLWYIWMVITLPLARPIIAMIFTSDQSAQTLTVVIANLASGRVSDYGLLSTAGVLISLPPVLIGIFLQRALVSGLTAGGVKG